MKRWLLTHVALFICIIMQAQDYKPLVQEGKQWHDLFSLFPPPTDAYYCTTTTRKIMGDTILDEVEYKKLYAAKYEDLSDLHLSGAIRENEIGQVFLRNFVSLNNAFGSEFMLYDFSLHPGDSICYEPPYCLKLLSVNDTILEGEYVSRKAYYFRYENNGLDWWDREVWIEGIGSLNGLCEPGFYFYVGGYYNLLCYYEDENLIWQHPTINECYTGVNVLEDSEMDNSISVYPNPAKEILIIEGVKPAEVQIYNTLVQLVKVVHGTNEISVANLPEGMYLLRIVDAFGKRRLVKVVVKK